MGLTAGGKSITYCSNPERAKIFLLGTQPAWIYHKLLGWLIIMSDHCCCSCCWAESFDRLHWLVCCCRRGYVTSPSWLSRPMN